MSPAHMRVLILSPHRDDAAFSCGLLAAGVLRHSASLVVVNVCTTSDYAPYLQPDTNTRFVQVTAERAAEDARFFAALSTHAGVHRNAVSEVNLGWSDAPLRLSLPAEAVLVEGVRQEEVEALAGVFRNLPEAEVILAPLALGGHLDHCMVREAAGLAFPTRLCFYEDLPYAARMTAEERNAEIAAVCSGLQPWSSSRPEPAGTKRAFSSYYPSQIAPDVADEMEQYAQARGGSETIYCNEESLHLLAQLTGGAQ